MSTFLQIQDAVLSYNLPEDRRVFVKNAINLRYAWVWDLEFWTFREATDAVTVTAGSQSVTSLPTDLGPVIALYNSDGEPLVPIEDIAEFQRLYLPSSTGEPAAYCPFGLDSILVGPTSSESSSTYTLLYEKRLTLLSADADVPALPAEHHMMLASGAAAHIYRAMRLREPRAAMDFEQEFEAGVTALRRGYLKKTVGSTEQWGKATAQWGD